MKLWWNDYVGIPYQAKGRTRDGADCWGLVRLVYKDQFGIDLPALDENYRTEDDKAIADLIAVEREGWAKTDMPMPGDVVVVRMFGQLAHVGIAAAPGTFLHVREGYAATIERLDAGAWKHRIEGFYRYEPKPQLNAITLAACAHPLQTNRIDGLVPADMTLAEIAAFIRESSGVPAPMQYDAVLMVDGRVIPRDQWDMLPAVGSRVEYRAVPGKSAVRTIVSVAVVVAAIVAAPYVAAAIGVSTAAGSVGLALTTAALTVAGTLLVNAIFPVRAADSSMTDPGTAERQNMLDGGRNNANQYGAIPVVLGQYRFTPPVGAINYVESNGTTSFLRMLLIWGYGPLQISDLRVGETKLESLENVEYETLNGDASDDRQRFNSLYGGDVSQETINVKLESDGTDAGSPWLERVIDDECDRITATLHFPEGMRRITLDGANAGKIEAAPFTGQVQVRQLDSATLAPLTAWGAIEQTASQQVVNLAPAWFNVDSDEAQEAVYRWTRISLDAYNRIIVRHGAFTQSPTAEPSGNLLTRLQNTTFGLNTTFDRLPELGDGEEELWQVCVYGNDVYQTVDKRGTGTAGVSGCGLTMSGLKATIAAGTVTRAQTNTINIGDENQEYFKRKDAFTINVSFSVPKGKYEVRVRRTNTSVNDLTFPSGNTARRYHDAYLVSVTGYDATRPVAPPKPLAMTALRVKATNQINGQIDGISATVQSICKDWDHTTETWVTRPTRNPASLLRYILQHPANAQAVPDSQIDLDALADWHNYCRTNRFMFDTVVVEQRSLMDVMRDVAAAGRASPALRDGKWTVIIDRARTTVAQFFTPHNSWGFEGVRTLPKLPHAFRVQFNNAEKGYQADEMIVYNDGYSASNATLFEGLSLPGVTTRNQVFKHARFHFAQLRLRPETYTLNADIEHLVCTRGDLVRVTHDVPMWGLGSGRIKQRVSSTALELDEQVPMEAGVQYTIRIRAADGSSVSRTVAAAGTDGLYSTITLTSGVTSAQAAAGDLFMFGALSEESVELIVQSIEPAENMSARITLVDYSPAVYDSDSEVIPAFDSQITQPPKLLQQVIKVAPTISSVVSDESVMLRLGPGQFAYRIKVAYTNPAGLPSTARYVEGQIAFAGDASLDWKSDQDEMKAGAVWFSDVQEGDQYKLRLRYVTADGYKGPWATTTHTVVGKKNPPATVQSLTLAVEGARLRLDWADSPEVDVVGYEVRTSNSGWGGSGFIFKGDVSTCTVAPGAVGVATTWFVKALDAAGNYSVTAASVSYTTAAPANVGSISETFADTSLTNATITLDWPDVAPVFGLARYEVSYDSVTKFVNASTITLPADWIGNRTFTVKTVDNLGNVSSGRSKTVTKLAPNPASNLRAQVIDNNVLLFWDLPDKTTLPIQHVLLKKGDAWATATVIGTKDGGFTSLQENEGGTYQYWVAVVDTDDNQSTPVSVSVLVGEPPDFVFHGEFDSAFSGTKSSAIDNDGGVLMPINTTETWAQHFTSRSWASPQAQVSAGFPVFIQPSNGSGYYEETFDFGTTLASSRITVTHTSTTIDGSPLANFTVSTSEDGSTWTSYPGAVNVFALNFRYVRVRVTVTDSAGDGIYRLESLNVRLDAKLKNDAGNVSCLASDASGTLANFEKEFIDVTSITVSPSGTSAVTAVYNFQDAIIAGTYSVASNVCTVNCTGHDLVVGQKVKLTFSTGTGVNGVYVVASVVNANSFTVAMVTANTSGNATIYPQGARIYLFNTSGTRVNGTASWSIKGY